MAAVNTPASQEAPCTNRWEESDRFAESFTAKPALSAADRSISSCSDHSTHPAMTASLRAAANASGRRSSTTNWVAFSGCNRFRTVAAGSTPAVSRGHMASAHKNSRARHHQKSHALRMLLTSGVVRSADVDPPTMGVPRSQVSPPNLIPSRNFVHTRLVHTTQYKRPQGLLAQWQTTFAEILKEFGKR